MSENDVTAKRLRLCREKSGETLEQIGQLVGVNKSTVMRWEHGDTWKINLPTLQFLADHFHVSLQWLLGETATVSVADDTDWLRKNGTLCQHGILLPILGAVRAGCGGEVQEEIVGYEAVDASTLQSGEQYFWLRVSGDSMTPSINDGDLVLIRRQEQVDNGQYAVVLIDNEEGLVKRVEYCDNGIELHSVNPYYPPRRFEKGDADLVRVLGLVVESRRKFV